MKEMHWNFEDIMKLDGWSLNFALCGLEKLKKMEERAARKAKMKARRR